MRRSTARPIITLIAITSVVMTALTACSGNTSPKSVAEPSQPAKVSIALDYIPNTNHIGIYAAQAKGFFKDENLTVKIVPYASTPAETLVAKGVADFGFSFSNGTASARASGLDVLQVFANISKDQYVLAYRSDDSSITSPKDLEGKTYAGFGTAGEDAEVSTVIKADGGKGVFKKVILDTAAYDAVYNKKADFTIAATTVEIIEAREIGKPLKYFVPADFGYPDNYSSNIISSNAYLRAHPEVARRFLRAVQKGYQFAQANPKQAAEILVAANKSELKNPSVVEKGAQLLAADGYLKNQDGKFGIIDDSKWSSFGNYLFKNRLLNDSKGKPLTQEPNWSDYYTNDFLPKD